MPSIIIVPTYNEAENIEPLMAHVAAVVPEMHLLIVDDNSPDGTAERAEQLARCYPGYRVYRRSGKRGLGRAYVDAFCKALREGYDQILQMDADLSHDPAYLPAMLAASEQADLVIGSRYCTGGGVENWPRRRVLLSQAANVYVRAITGVPTGDATAGFRCWSRRALAAVQVETVQSEGYAFQVEMVFRAYKAGLRIAEVPIVFTDRRFGQSKLSGRVITEALTMPWRLRFGRTGAIPRRQETVPRDTTVAVSEEGSSR
jgi:dolichol-phosphate mannosyltransferase